jgi:hypothetical protein
LEGLEHCFGLSRQTRFSNQYFAKKYNYRQRATEYAITCAPIGPPMSSPILTKALTSLSIMASNASTERGRISGGGGGGTGACFWADSWETAP